MKENPTKQKYDFLFKKLLRDCKTEHGLLIVMTREKYEICSKISISEHGKTLPNVLRGLAADIEKIIAKEET